MSKHLISNIYDFLFWIVLIIFKWTFIETFHESFCIKKLKLWIKQIKVKYANMLVFYLGQLEFRGKKNPSLSKISKNSKWVHLFCYILSFCCLLHTSGTEEREPFKIPFNFLRPPIARTWVIVPRCVCWEEETGQWLKHLPCKPSD